MGKGGLCRLRQPEEGARAVGSSGCLEGQVAQFPGGERAKLEGE